MKTRTIIIMLFIILGGCIWSADASAEQDYPMVCKGGENMKERNGTISLDRKRFGDTAGSNGMVALDIRTGTLTYTGRGGEANVQPFAPVQIRTGTLTYSGRGGESNVQPFAPVQIRTGTLTYTGPAR
jgi:hypothetical protein